MAKKIKIHKGRWKDNKPSAYEISEVSSMDIDASFNSINEKLKSIRGMEPIDYQSIDSQMEKANELLEGVCYYIGETLDDIDDYIDTPFYDRFNHKTGILESFEKINLDNYKTKNELGIKDYGSKQVYDYPNGRYKTEVYEEELEEIGFKDILSNLDVKGKPGMPSFAQMMEEQYRNAVTNSELDVSYDDYVEALLHRSDIEHTVDRGWLNYISDGLETIGVISFVGMITGENFITGEILTDKEREQAGLNTIVNVGVLLATIASAGGGSLAALGLKQGLIEGVKLGTKTLAVDMISGISGLATVNLLEAAGSPEYMAVIAGMGMSFLGGYCGEKYISKVGSISNVTVDNKEVDIGSVDDWLRSMSPEDAARYRQHLDLLDSKKLNATKNIEKIDDIAKGTSGDNIITDGSHLGNGTLKPNSKYTSGEHNYEYKTNQDGLISNAKTDSLKLKTHEGRLPHNPNTTGKLDGDHAGHLFGDRFGGSPELDNLVSQAKEVNLSEFKVIENEWAKALQQGKNVSVDITVNYISGSTRPSSFDITYIIDGIPTITTIFN